MGKMSGGPSEKVQQQYSADKEALHELGADRRYGDVPPEAEFYDKAKEIPYVGPATQYLYGDNIRRGKSDKAVRNFVIQAGVGAAL